jgi:hypothetical protein
MKANGRPPGDDEARFRSLPRKLWVKWSGRPHTTLDRQAASWGCPLGGSTIDLADLARWLHDFLAVHSGRLRGAGRDPELVELDRELRREQVALRKLERLEREGRLVDSAKQMGLLRQFAMNIRNCGDLLRQQFGEGALEILNEALDANDRLIDQAQAERNHD